MTENRIKQLLNMKENTVVKTEASRLLTDFCREFSFVSISEETVQKFLTECKLSETEPKTALLLDYVLSQDLADDIVL